MKKCLMLATLFMLVSLTVQAQYDDVYYDPSRDANRTTTTPQSRPTTTYNNNTSNANGDVAYQNDDNASADSQYYEYDDEYDDYQYASRIRRFHRPYRGFNYYDVARSEERRVGKEC